MGCSLPTAPSNLISPPQANEADIKLKQDIEKLLPREARLTIPATQAGNSQTFFELDINGDGVDEVMAFYKLGNDGFQLGFMVLTPTAKGGWRELSRVDEYATDINLVEFVDIDGNGITEIMVGWAEGSYDLSNKLVIYSWTGNDLAALEPIPYRTMTSGDIDGDGRSEIAISKEKRVDDIPSVVVEIYKYKTGGFTINYTIEYEGCYPGELLIGKANEDTQGIFIETYLGAHSAATHLLVYSDGELQEAWAGDDADLITAFKPYPLPSKDVNGDGIIEVGVHKAPSGTFHLAMVEIPWVENWYRFDGDKGLEWVSEIYGDYGNNFAWKIPTEWLDKYTITREYSERKSRVDFYDLAEHSHKLFTLLSIEKELWEAESKYLEAKGHEYKILGENDLLNLVYIAIMPEPYTCQCLKPISISSEEVQAHFSIADELR